MPPRFPCRTSRRSFLVFLVVGVVAAAMLVFPGASFARTTNVVNLDDGTCGQNLQMGSDKTASRSATPSFLLWGDGGLSSYAISIDGLPLGTFNSDGFANVCITTIVPLVDGAHVLTATELAPHPTLTVAPFNFTVDTVPPPPPSPPVVSGYSDSGVLGDGITRFRNVNFTGTSAPNMSIQLFSGPTVYGGARADGAGFWSATTTPLARRLVPLQGSRVRRGREHEPAVQQHSAHGRRDGAGGAGGADARAGIRHSTCR